MARIRMKLMGKLAVSVALLCATLVLGLTFAYAAGEDDDPSPLATLFDTFSADGGTEKELTFYSYNNEDDPDYVDEYNGTWIDPGAGRVATDDNVPAEAATKFTVTIPRGTAFTYKEDCDTTEGDNVTKHTAGDSFQGNVDNLRLVSVQYGALWGSFETHRVAINQHMSWHTGVKYPDSSGDSTNDAQFWRLFFIDEDGNEISAGLPEGDRATVEVEYLEVLDTDNPDAEGAYPTALRGRLGTRRTCVMEMGDILGEVPSDFVGTDNHSLATPSGNEYLGKTDEHYTKLTYYIDASKDDDGTVTSAWGNLTALCSMKLPNVYVQNLSVSDVQDGSDAFDAPEANGAEDKPGNDSEPDNRIVRTFDSVIYTLSFASGMRASQGETAVSYTAVVEADLDMDIAQARFSATEINKIFDNDTWKIEYRDKDGKALYVETNKGLFKCGEDGNAVGKAVSMNDIVSGSSTSEEGGAYRSNVASQHLMADFFVSGTESSPAASAEATATVQVDVTASKNGDIVAPSFKVYAQGNKDNFAPETDGNGGYVVSDPSTANEESTRDTGNEVKVSAAARYNVVLKRNADFSYSSYFDLSTGKETTADDENGTYGRLSSYGITLQLFNETNVLDEKGSQDAGRLTSKGLRGIELPVDGISFDVKVEGTPGENCEGRDDYSALLWDFRENMERPSAEPSWTGGWDRNMYWNNANTSTFAKGSGIYNRGGSVNAAYNGGSWSVKATSDTSGDLDSDNKTTDSITNNGSQVTYTFTVKDFDFDFDNLTSAFPSESAGNAGSVNWLSPSYIGAFSGGHIQVLQKYPDNPKEDATPNLDVLVGSSYTKDGDGTITITGDTIDATSLSGQKVTTETSKINDALGGVQDNTDVNSTPIYVPGGISKHNSFGARNGHGSISTGFLGTDYWHSPEWDANAYAGSKIYLWGGAQLGRNSDGVVSAYNLLQKFDSSKLSIDTSEGVSVRYTEVNNDSAWPAVGTHDGVADSAWNILTNSERESATLLPAAGESTILYAADPLYPNGWDADNEAQWKRMNEATEEDLVYFEKLSDLEGKGYTCIGVLLEVRNANIPAGCYPGLRIPMVMDNESVGKVAMTVNTARMWIKSSGRAYNIFADDLTGGKADENISWKNGSLNSLTPDDAYDAMKNLGRKNVITDDSGKDLYDVWWNRDKMTSDVNAMLRERYDSTARYLVSGYNNTDYHKTVYANGTKVDGTHEGYQQGMSLLFVGYESEVKVKVQNTATTGSGSDSETSSGNVVFNPGSYPGKEGEGWRPLYTIHGINTTPSTITGTSTQEALTDLTIKATLTRQTKTTDDKGDEVIVNTPKENELALGSGTYKVKTLVNGEETWIDISDDVDNPTEVTFTGTDGKNYTYTIWADMTSGTEVEFQLRNVPVGQNLPDIQFGGQLGGDIENNNVYNAKVAIWGTGDTRALSSNNQNLAEVNIVTTVLAQTRLVKSVDNTLIEQNGKFTYTVEYTNAAKDPMRTKLYMYDLMPYNGDIRNSSYTTVGDEFDEDGVDELTVESVSAGLSTGSTSNGAVARVYYSVIAGSVLREYVDFGNTSGTDGTGVDPKEGQDIDIMLRDALIGNDANGVWYVVKESDVVNGVTGNPDPVHIYRYGNKADGEEDIVKGINIDAVDYDVDSAYGSVKPRAGYRLYNVRFGYTVDSNGVVYDKSGNKVAGVPDNTTGHDGSTVVENFTVYKMFRWLGSMTPGGNDNTLAAAGTHLDSATCIYAVVENLDAESTLSLDVTCQTHSNKGADLYGNIAHSWIQGQDRTGQNLTSNQVATRVVGRQIAGVIWEDLNHDGVRNKVGSTDEPRISDVTCTLFKWNVKERRYEAVKANDGPNGRNIMRQYQDENGNTVNEEVPDGQVVQVVTGANGIYGFSELPEGNYVVAFSGDVLGNYDGETTYQVNDGQDNVTSDGVDNGHDNALRFCNADGSDFTVGGEKYVCAYYIKYNKDSKVSDGSNILLHTLDDIRAGKVSLSRGSIESISYQDLGLVIDRYELPETGGSGTTAFYIGGGLLVATSALGALALRRRGRETTMFGKLTRKGN